MSETQPTRLTTSQEVAAHGDRIKEVAAARCAHGATEGSTAAFDCTGEIYRALAAILACLERIEKRLEEQKP